MDIIWSVLFGVTIATLIPYLLLLYSKLKFSIENSECSAAALAQLCQCSNFVTAVTFLEMQNYTFSGHGSL
jgi:hypothetical protein